jgi:hypothetical protein
MGILDNSITGGATRFCRDRHRAFSITAGTSTTAGIACPSAVTDGASPCVVTGASRSSVGYEAVF